jgi:hypothetical protein
VRPRKECPVSGCPGLRLTLECLTVVAFVAVSGWATARSVARAVESAVLTESAALHTLPSLVDHGTGARPLHLNGATLLVESGHERRPLTEWLAAARESCHTSVAQPMPTPPGAPERAFWVEVQGDTSALAGCLVGPGLASTVDGLAAQLRALSKDLDLSRLGELRVLRAQHAGNALHVVSVRSFGALPLVRMFPPRGDAPGGDLPRVPRPPQARRLMSAYEGGRAPALAVYSRPGDLDELLRAEAHALAEAGFTSAQTRAGSAWRRGDELVLLAGRARGADALLMVLSLGLGPLSVSVEAEDSHLSTQPPAAPRR